MILIICQYYWIFDIYFSIMTIHIVIVFQSVIDNHTFTDNTMTEKIVNNLHLTAFKGRGRSFFL